MLKPFINWILSGGGSAVVFFQANEQPKYSLHSAKGPWNKRLNFIFPTGKKYVILNILRLAVGWASTSPTKYGWWVELYVLNATPPLTPSGVPTELKCVLLHFETPTPPHQVPLCQSKIWVSFRFSWKVSYFEIIPVFFPNTQCLYYFQNKMAGKDFLRDISNPFPPHLQF